MLTKLTLRHFKRFREAEIELGGVVVFIGPNNSGKTTALQALALWELGLHRWLERHGSRGTSQELPSATLNRRDLVSLPLPDAALLWKDARSERPMELIVEGVTQGEPWRCGLRFHYANEESLACRPLEPLLPEGARQVRLAYLSPMSGLISNETRLPPGAIAVRIGEGRTAEVLRNLCYQLLEQTPERWEQVRTHMRELFGVHLDEPRYLPSRGEIEMTYRDMSGVQLDLSCAGRGLQQTLLLLACIHVNPGAVLLLDEPDTHLEILRQLQIYHVLTEAARQQGSQILAASHSEVLLNEAADRDMVVAFVGKPHRIDDRGNQVAKALKELGFEQYYQAEQKGWVLYLEGSTDLAILRAFAKTLAHPAAAELERPFIHYVGNRLSKARQHFHGLRETLPDLTGVVILDRDAASPTASEQPLRELRWARREIENYLCQPQVLYAFAEQGGARPLMEELVRGLTPPVALANPDDRWWREMKASDDFLDRLFESYFARLGLPNLMRKTDYHQLAALVPRELIDPEVSSKLDTLLLVARAARPVRDPETDVEPPPGG